MALWGRALGSSRVRTAVAYSRDIGTRQAYEETFFRERATPANVELSFGVDLSVVGNETALYDFAIELPAAIDAFEVAGWSVVADHILVPATIEAAVVGSSASVRTSFDTVVCGEVYAAGAHATQAWNSAPIVSAYRDYAPVDTLVDVPATTATAILSPTYPTGVISSFLGYPLDYIMPGSIVGSEAEVGALAYPLTYVRVAIRHDSELGMQWLAIPSWAVAEEGTLNLRYRILTDSGQELVESGLDVSYQMVTYTLTESELRPSYALRIPELNESSLDLSYAARLAESGLGLSYGHISVPWIDTFVGLLNGLRASLGLSAMCVRDTTGYLNIAEMHARNMKSVGVYSHESADLPEGARTFLERRGKIRERLGESVENIAATYTYNGNWISPNELFDAWVGSPGHYANMTHDWPASATPSVQFAVEPWTPEPIHVGSLSGPVLGPTGGYWTLYVLVIIDTTPPVTEVLMQSTLNLSWGKSAPVYERLNLLWDQKAYKRVRATHQSPYALLLAAQHEVPWGVTVAAQHAAPQHYTVSRGHEAPYSETEKLAAGLASYYDVQQRLIVTASHAGSHALRVARQMAAEYARGDRIRSSITGIYGAVPTARASQAFLYGDAPRLVAQNASPYSILRPVAGQNASTFNLRPLLRLIHEAAYGDEVRVAAGHAVAYDLAVRNLLASAHSGMYSLHGSSIEIVDVVGAARLAHIGRPVDFEELAVSTNEDDFVWTIEAVLCRPEDYAAIRVDDTLQATVGGVEYAGIVTGKTLQRDDTSSALMRITARSPAARFTEPRASTMSYTLAEPKAASVLAQEILGVPIIWGIVDWIIPTARYAVESSTPIAAVQLIANAAGGVIVSRPDGSLEARYRYPVAVPDFYTAVPAIVLTDVEDNLSFGETTDTTDTFNWLRVRDGADEVTDFMEFIQDEDRDDSGELLAYAIPWREVVVEHTGGAAVFMTELEAKTREHTEKLEVIAGRASLAYPAASVVSIKWLSDELAGAYVEPRTKEFICADTTTNYGYGLIEVTYVVEYYSCRVQFPVGNSAQFILRDKR